MSILSIFLWILIILVVISIIIGLVCFVSMMASAGGLVSFLMFRFMVLPWIIVTAIVSVVIAGTVALIVDVFRGGDFTGKYSFLLLLLIPLIYIVAKQITTLPEKIWNYKPKNIEIAKDDNLNIKKRKIEKLIKKGRLQSTPFHKSVLTEAILNQDVETVRMLISEYGADVNELFSHDTPLTLALQKGNLEIMELLIDNGADVNKNDVLGYAVELNNIPAMQILLKAGADVNARHERWTPLMRAAHDGNSGAIKLLIEKGTDVNIKDTDNRTAFDIAIEYGQTDVAKTLLAAMSGKININALNYRGNTLLIEAAKSGHTETVKYLLGLGADIEAKSSTGLTALVEAAESGRTEIVLLLLEKGADINAKNKREENALYWAVRYNHPDTVKELLDAGIDIKPGKPLWNAANYGYAEIVHLLLEAGANPNEADIYGETALMAAVEEKSIETVKLLLSVGADINAKDKDGRTALSIASAKKYTDISKLLLEKINGKNTSDLSDEDIVREISNNLSPAEKEAAQSEEFTRACQYGYRNIIEELLEAGFKPSAKHAAIAIERREWLIIKKLLEEAGLDPDQKDDEGVSLLLRAIGKKDLDIVKSFVENGADLNVEDKDLKIGPPLISATIHGSLPIVEYLLQRKVDINTTNQFGETALILAAAQGHTNIALFLIRTGADVNKAKNDGTTPLKFAAGKGNQLLIKQLLEAGANINAADKDNDTPLISACFMGHEMAAEVLLKAGAKTDIRDREGKTAMDCAKEKGYTKIVELLKSYGAQE